MAIEVASLPDNSELLALEEEIIDQHELATAHDDEMERLAAIWTKESRRLYDEGAFERSAGRQVSIRSREIGAGCSDAGGKRIRSALPSPRGPLCEDGRPCKGDVGDTRANP